MSWDTTVVVDQLPGPDEKVIASSLVESVGGVTANAAIACSLAGTRSRLLTCLGTDFAGTSALEAAERTGLAVTAHISTDHSTCRALITLDGSGEKRLILAPNAAMYPPDSCARDVDLTEVAWVHTALYDLDSAALIVQRCRDQSISWSVDLEPATIPRSLDELEPHLRGCTTVFANTRAAQRLGTTMAEDLRYLGVQEIVETLGPHGARLVTDRRVVRIPAPDISAPVLDTTGAGDALAGWFVSERLAGQTTEAALRTAVDAASYTVRFRGASASYPNRRALAAQPVR
ncbi:MAG: carbohydrate kinase family protein [Mycobacterium sp.]